MVEGYSARGGAALTDDEFDAVVASAYPGLLAYAQLLTRDRAQAEDVVHEALVRCIRRARRTTIRQLVPYARRAVVNEVIRSADRRRMRTELIEPQSVHPQDVVIVQQTLRGWLAGLPARQRVAVVSRFYLDLSEQDTADVLGCSVSAVKSLCQRGLAALRADAAAADDQAPRARRARMNTTVEGR